MDDDTMTAREAADLLGVSRQRINYLRKTGRITPVGWGWGGQRIYPREQIDELLRRRAARQESDHDEETESAA